MTESRRFVFVSDSHSSPRTAESDLNWSAVLGYIESAEPDLVVHVGDLSLDGAHGPADLAFARSRLDLLDRLGVPWLAVPGNHDVGDKSQLAAAPGYGYIPAAARDRPAGLFGQRRVDLVVSGHVHQYRELRRDGMTHLWVPTTWAVLPDSAQAVIGAKRCGLIAVELTGTGEVEHDFIVPDGLRQLTIAADIPNPYDH